METKHCQNACDWPNCTLQRCVVKGKQNKRLSFEGISLEKKWKERNELEGYSGNKSGGQFMRTVIDYKGQNFDYSPL